jgi:outer membrane protein assembly factor BamB
VSGDHSGPGHLLALDRKTGDVVWRTKRGDHASYSTPIIGQFAGKPQVLLSGCDMVTGYDPDTGRELWRVKGPTEVTACTMAFGSGLAFASGGFPGKGILAIRPDGSGDVTETHVAWKSRSGVTYVPSPLFDGGRLYMVNDQGFAHAFDAATGKLLWKHRLGGNFTASPVLAAGNIFVANEEGTTFVFTAGPTFHQVAENKLDDGQFATMAIAGGRIYVRTLHHLYAIGDQK